MGLVAASAVALTSTGSRRSPRPSPPAAGAYLAAWRRSQLGTWRVVLRWERRAGGGRLDDEIRIAQRPPDRLVTGALAVDARRDGRRLACAAGDGGRLRCRDAGAAPPYDQQVAQQEAVLRQQVVGPQALYSVVGTGTGCFELRLRFVRFPAPPYGRLARFCFDGATGAPTLLDIDRIEGSDRQVAVQVSGSVSDEDLTPPQEAAQ